MMGRGAEGVGALLALLPALAGAAGAAAWGAGALLLAVGVAGGVWVVPGRGGGGAGCQRGPG